MRKNACGAEASTLEALLTMHQDYKKKICGTFTSVVVTIEGNL
jgi:hypothetical protein